MKPSPDYWNRAYHGPSLSESEISKLLGADHVAWVRSTANPAITAKCRASGAWDANNAEAFCAYTHLAALLRK